MQRNPTLSMIENLRFTRTGTAWADFVLTGLPYGLRPKKDLNAARTLHAGLFRSLPGESLLLGLCAGLDPAVTVERMVADIDLDECPDWRIECEAMLEWLDSIGPGQRIYWLSVPLSSGRKLVQGISGPMAAKWTELRDELGLARPSISEKELEARVAQSMRILERIPTPFGARPATPAQMVWLSQHALHRGLFQDMELPTVDEDDLSGPGRKSGCALGEPLLDEGAQSDLEKAQKLKALQRRVLKVSDPGSLYETAPSYQVLSTVVNTPDGGFPFPGGELLGRVDTCGQDVDWAIRLNVTAGREVMARNQRAIVNLTEQLRQRDGEASSAMNMLDRVAADIAEYAAVFESNQLEVETQATVIFAIGAQDYETVRQRSVEFASWARDSGYKVEAPLGAQEELWWAMHPGIPSTGAVREFAQITTAHNLAALIPFASVHLGDTKGSVFALNITNGPLLDENYPCGPTELVHHDLEGAADRNLSGSMAVAGELGAGKTATLMKLASDVVDKGGQLVITDRTQKGEWASWAQGMTDVVIVDPSDSAVSLDPLRAFGLDKGAKMALTFLTPLLRVKPTSEEGTLLNDVLDPEYLQTHHLHSLAAVRKHLEHDCKLARANEVFRQINVFARRDFGRIVFDDSLPPLDINTGAVVVRTHTVTVPKREDLELPHLFEQLDATKLYGRALHALIAAAAREICFADTSRLACFVVSEAHAMTVSHEGESELIDFVRDGRKHRAAVLMDSHDPLADFGSVTLRGLIPTRLLMRHSDKELAARGLEWLGLDPTDAGLLDLISRDTSPATGANDKVPVYRRGEGLMRDMAGNIGRVKVLLPARPERSAAITAGGTAAARHHGKREEAA